MIKKAGNLFAAAYLILIFGVYPFYMKEGYVDIGKAKYLFFLCCSLAATGILTLIGIICKIQSLLLQYKQNKLHFPDLSGLSSTDMFVMLFATELFLSFVYSDHRQEALWGTEGWYMGLVLFLSLCALYFLISRFWRAGSLVWYTGIVVSGIVFLLGILDRFSLYLIPLEIRQSGFISTLGNINWFCGYLSVLAPLGTCPLIFQESSDVLNHQPQRLICTVYTLIAFTAGFCQGSSSIFLFWAALFFGLLWIAAPRRLWLINCLLPFSLWCFSAQLMRILLFLFPGGYNYEKDNLCLRLAGSDGILLIGTATLILFLFLNKKSKTATNNALSGISSGKTTRRVLAGLLLAALSAWLCLSCINTSHGISFLSDNSLFLLDPSWGNGRGAALKAGYQLFVRMPPLKKVLGAGPDCFSSLAYSIPEVAAELNNAFGGSRLTNAHNELLTCLVNTGIAGTFFYLGIFLSFTGRCIKRGDRQKALYLLAVSAFCYLTHNLVSFSQVLNLPFIFLLMGMGEAILRQGKSNS